MKRTQGWEKRLAAVIAKHKALPSQYGISDCFIIPRDAVEAVTGEVIFPGVEYTNEIGAAKELRARGFETVADAFHYLFPIIHPVSATRGDLGVVEDNGQLCGGVFTSIGFMTRNQEKVVFLPPSKVLTAYKVG